MKKIGLIFICYLVFSGQSLIPPEPNQNPNTGSGAGSPKTTVNSNVNLNGFNESNWETPYDTVRKTLMDLATAQASPDKIEILYEDPQKYMDIRRNGVLYTYRFYQPPEKILEFKDGAATGTAAAPAEPKAEWKYGRLFFVTIRLPMLLAEDVQKELVKKYQNPTKPVLDKDGNGVYIWELNGGYVFQWREKFEDRYYTRRVDYISTKLRDELVKDYDLYFTAEEKKTLSSTKW